MSVGAHSHFWGSGACELRKLLCGKSTPLATKKLMVLEYDAEAVKRMCRDDAGCGAGRAATVRLVRDPFGAADAASKRHALQECCARLSEAAPRRACAAVFPPVPTTDGLGAEGMRPSLTHAGSNYSFLYDMVAAIRSCRWALRYSDE